MQPPTPLRGATGFIATALFCFTLTSPAAEATSQPPKSTALNFINDIEPILTKAGCNSGGCHAKAGTGQRGFRLSLLGFEPQEDYEYIVKEGKGRRVFPAAPEQSLLVLKAANIVPHGGGKKLDPASHEYATLVRWIREGMAYGRLRMPSSPASPWSLPSCP
ncbi:hypothetical protein [Verrucomicrobium spinosum]|uniref:hypothetical protein n=1 Tax=Verrucomicrobium spinosum TaxID=2736 RepID=UPI000946295A|nr:hypothetical protein [Verrucomicrobium spinosum]